MSSTGSTMRPVSSLHLAGDAVVEGLAQLEQAAGERPMAFEGLVAAAHQEHAALRGPRPRPRRPAAQLETLSASSGPRYHIIVPGSSLRL